MTDSTSAPDGSLAAHVAGTNWDDTEPDNETGASASTARTRAATVAPKPKGFYVPKWVAAATVVVVIGGAGFAVGQVTASDNTGSAAASAQSPFGNGGFGPFTPRQGSGTVPGGVGSGSTSGGTTPGSNSTGNGSGTQTIPSTTGQAFLGVSVQDAANAQGATIGTVASGSPAATAGLHSGDVVTAVDGTAVTTASDLGTAIHAHQPGDNVTITYQHNGTTATVQVTLGSPAAASTTPSN